MIDACKLGDIEEVKNIILSGKTLPSMALRLAAENGYMDMVKYLVEKGGDKIGESYSKALCGASGKGHIEIVAFLSEVIKKNGITGSGERAMVNAASNGHLNVLKYLVEHANNIYDCHRSVIVSAAGKGHLDIIEYLLSVADQQRHVLDDALCIAGANGHLAVVKYLSDHGASCLLYTSPSPRDS